MTPTTSPSHAALPRGWQASLRLVLSGAGERTRVVERRHHGPLLIQRPFYPEQHGCCHVILVHPPGGVVGGDELELSLSVIDRGHGLVTTPAATKLYRSAGATAKLQHRLEVRTGATLEWLPQETIAFNGSRSSLSTRVELGRGSSFIGWEVTCLGRPAAGERYSSGSLCQKFELTRDGAPLFNERLALSGAGPELSEPWGLMGRSVSATLVASGPRLSDEHALSQLIERLRAIAAPPKGLCAASHVSGVLVLRVLCDGASAAKSVLTRAWQIVRQALLERQAIAPRIWAT